MSTPRLLALSGAVAIATALLVVVPSAPASAAALSNAQFQVGRGAGEDGPATCTTTNSDTTSPITNFASNAPASSASHANSSTITDNSDATDSSVITNSAKGTVKATEVGGRLRSVNVTLAHSTQLTSNQGLSTDCDPEADEGIEIAFQAVLPAAQWVTVTLRGTQSITSGYLYFIRSTPPTAGYSAQLGATGKVENKATLLLPAGTYLFTAQLARAFNAPQTSAEPTSQSGTIGLDITLADAGGAIAKAAGSGKKFLKVGDAVNCGTNKLTSKFTNAAGIAASAKVKKATFFVNGKKKKSIGLPTKGDKVTLTNLKSDKQMDLKVVIQLFRGAPVTVTRSYLSCT